MSTEVVSPRAERNEVLAKDQNLVVYIFSHSPIMYWWPVWLVGYVLALLSYFQGVTTKFGDTEVLIHPSPALGVIFTVTFLLVILMTNRSARGLASLTVIIAIVAAALFLAYMDWWDEIFRLMGKLAIFMNLGFYVFFSTAVFLVWAASIFFFDRLEYWEFRPGQAIHHAVLGEGENVYDARGMVVEKLRNDLFRHWLLGLGAGDIHLHTSGAKTGDFVIKNVAFVGGKLLVMQRLAAMQPDDDPQIAKAPLPQA